jgi:hypothetical protein
MMLTCYHGSHSDVLIVVTQEFYFPIIHSGSKRSELNTCFFSKYRGIFTIVPVLQHKTIIVFVSYKTICPTDVEVFVKAQSAVHDVYILSYAFSSIPCMQYIEGRRI